MKNRAKPAALLAAVLTVVFLCSFATTAEKSYTFEEIGVSVSLPAELRALRYPVEEGDPFIPLTGWNSASDLNQYYKEMGILLHAYFPDTGASITVENWSDEESMFLETFAAQSEEQLLARIADYPQDWGGRRMTASLENCGGQPFLLHTTESEEGVVLRYFETVLGGCWFSLRLYSSADGSPLLEEELAVLDNAMDTLSLPQGDPVEGLLPQSWQEIASIAAVYLGLVLFLLVLIFLARSVRRSRPAPPVLPGFVCRVSTPVGYADIYRDYLVVFPAGRQPLSFWHAQTGGVAETEDCFWVYPPNLPPLPLPKDGFAAGSPERLHELLPEINGQAERGTVS